jgi:hypothetical protein
MRTPPRFPVPARDHRTLRQPPLSGMTSPASGFAPNQVKNSNRSSSDHNLSASAAKVGVSIKEFTIANYTSKTYYTQDLKVNVGAKRATPAWCLAREEQEYLQRIPPVPI